MKTFLTTALILLLLSACNAELLSASSEPRPTAPSQDSLTLQASSPEVPESTALYLPPVKLKVPAWPEPAQDAGEAHRAGAELYLGSEVFTRKRLPSKAASVDGDIVLNFVNADIQEVAKAVLGDMLHLNYTIASSVQGNVTITINRPIRKDEVLPVLGTVFRLNGAAIVESGGVVKVVSIADASKQGTYPTLVNRMSAQGFGAQIVSLRYTSADEMRRVLEPVAPPGGVIPVDSARNILILAGTEDERASMMDVVQTFDMDWLSGMSFGLFPLKESSAKDMVKQLWEVMGTPTGPLSKLLRLVPLERQNAVLAISLQPRYVKEVKTWIERLDLDRAPSDQKMWVYSVQNGRAVDLAETLNKLLGHAEAGIDGLPKDGNAIPVPPPLPVATMAEASNTPAPPSNTRFDSDRTDSAAHAARVIADEATNSLIVMGSKAEFLLIEDALKKLDIVPLQVRIEAVIAEVTLTDELRYGVQYLFKNKNAGTVLTNANALSISPTVPGFSAFITSSQISAVLDLLQTMTTVHVISSPQLMVLNNQTATLQIGDQVPVATQSAVSVVTPGAPVVNSIQLKDTGVILRVTPRVNASGMVVMDISQEVSDVAKTTTSTLDSPTIQQRKIASSVAVRDGETMALGGLIKDSVTEGKDGIPLLQDIPLAGSLFSTTTKANTRTELLVLITPRVVKNDTDMRMITHEMRQQMNAVAPLDAKIRATPVRR